MSKIQVKILDNGKVDGIYSAPIPVGEFDGWISVDVAPKLSDYWNGGEFVNIGEPPSPHHTFDYTTKQWIDPRSLDEIKAQKWAEIKSERDLLEFGGFEFEGGVYDSDQASQGRIMVAAVAGVDQVWT